MSKSVEDPKKAGALIVSGHAEGLKKAIALLEEFNLPLGLLPLENVVELGYVKSTGYIWITQAKPIQHQFKLIGNLVSYATEINGYLAKNAISKLSGVKAKELFIWANVNEISLGDPSAGKIHFKAFGGIAKIFPVEAFATGQ
ncbi:hypothetical protein O6H91_23G037900 [Diphasiastrum complanatum]|uniref:Uncharacterized protein n=1 Tax=Diphasiastrum complanatum TaxID=34168 RepID=A0ACC2A9X6_DIPCM|nr:hypothetical protein O6H91_23G037900 [Diphasiastrum complanatum]